jgi:predicted HicB family RNase H-like nuclease
MASPDYNSIPVGNGTKKTVTITFRIDENVITKLRNEADNREISLNTLANQKTHEDKIEEAKPR